MPAWKPAYLIHGDDHGRIAERRAALRALAEGEAGSAGVTVLEGEACVPDAVARALTEMSLALGRRFVIADGAERFKEADVTAIAGAMAGMDVESLTVAFFAREDGRAKAPSGLHDAVRAAGGAISCEGTVKPWELPRWAQEHARVLGIELDTAAARALVAQVGERQQRLARELEKLALELGSGTRVSVQDVEATSAPSAERRIWALGDALVAGRREDAVRALLELRAQGERLPGLVFALARRLRDAVAVAEALAAGRPASDVKRSLRLPGKAADRFIADVARRDLASLRNALELVADLELESRGGTAAPLAEDTAAVRAVLGAT